MTMSLSWKHGSYMAWAYKRMTIEMNVNRIDLTVKGNKGLDKGSSEIPI